MIQIAIIDDDKQELQTINQCIKNFEDFKNTISVKMFHSANEFLYDHENIQNVDIVFSDIEMDDINGIELGTILREKYPHIYLIFLTSHAEYAVTSYLIDAYQYILKQHMETRIPTILKQLIHKITTDKENVKIIKTSSTSIKLIHGDIIYIQKIKGSKYVEYITVNGTYKERTTLEHLLKDFNSSDFIMAERSYIVNINHIVRMKNNIIYLSNGEQLVVGRGRSNEVRQAINRCWGNLS